MAAFKLLSCPNYLRRLQWLTVFRLLDCAKDSTILDLGAGPMYYAVAIAQRCPAQVIAVDLDFQADRISKATDLDVKPIRANAGALPFSDQSIDRVLMSSLLHMVPEPLNVLRECRRVMTRDGHAVISVPNNYQFIPRILDSFAGPVIRKCFRLPHTSELLVQQLNTRFQVGGPHGYYSLSRLAKILDTAGLEIIEHKYAPGRFGSFLWELAVIGYVRFGNIVLHLLLLTYPIAWVCEQFRGSSVGSEHIVKVRPVRGR